MTLDINRFNMIREIKEQPRIIRDTIEAASKQAPSVRQLFDEQEKTDKGSVFLIGCGTSHYAAIAGKYALMGYADLPSVACAASDYRDFEKKKRGDIVFAFSQSGETGDVLTAIREARKHDCNIIAITNEAKSTIVEASDIAVVAKAGKELAVPMTKTYTALLTAHSCLAEELGRKKQEASQIRKIPRIVGDTIRTSEAKIIELSDEVKDANAVFILGRGPSYATALEASLKLKEAALVHAEAFQSPEFRHGPKAMLQPGTVVIAFTQFSEFDATTIRLLRDMRDTHATMVSIGDGQSPVVPIERLPYHLTPIPDIVPLQLLAFYTAVGKGINPDEPRNLIKTTMAT